MVEQRKRDDGVIVFRVVTRWKGYPSITRTFGPLGTDWEPEEKKKTDTLSRAERRAGEFDQRLKILWREQRQDLLQAIRDGVIAPKDVIRMKLSKLLTLEVKPAVPEPKQIGNLKDTWIEKLKGGLKSRMNRTYAPATIERYSECMDAVILRLPMQRDMPIGALNFETLEPALVNLVESRPKFSNASRNRHMTAVQAFVRWLGSRRSEGDRVVLTFTAPDWHELKAPEEADDEKTHIMPKQLEMILEGEKEDLWRDLWTVLAYTGLRVQECQTLRVSDVEDKEEALWLKIRPKGTFRPKTKKSIRDVPVIYPVVEAIVRRRLASPDGIWLWPRLQRSYRSARFAWARACQHANLGELRPPAALIASLQSAAAAAEREPKPVVDSGAGESTAKSASPGRYPQLPADVVPGSQWWWAPSVTIHGLRHHAALRWIEAGIPPTDVRDFLGHASLGLLDRYTRNRDDAEKASRARRLVLANLKTAESTTPQGTP